jgi:hypothetical protein
MARTPSYADLTDVTDDYRDREPASVSIRRGVLIGAATGIVLVALFMVAYLAVPVVQLPWTFAIAAGLLVVLFFFMLRIPYTDTPFVAEPAVPLPLSAATVANQEEIRREEQIEAIKKLREDAKAAKEAVAEIPHERMPMKWASAMEKMGWIHLELAIQEKALLGRRADILTVRQAGGAFRKALRKRTMEKTPQEWALAMLGLGNVCLMIGERSASPPHLEEAVTAFTESLKVLTEEKNPGKPAEAINGITKARQVLAEIRAQEETQMDDGDIF